MASDPPKVFISYSHDSPEHARRVLGLAERLRKDGADAPRSINTLPGHRPKAGPAGCSTDWIGPHSFWLFVQRRITRRFRGHEEPGKGKRADWEGNLITLEMYDAKVQRRS